MEQGRLARAVRADDRVALARRDVERDAADDLGRAEVLVHVDQFESAAVMRGPLARSRLSTRPQASSTFGQSARRRQRAADEQDDAATTQGTARSRVDGEAEQTDRRALALRVDASMRWASSISMIRADASRGERPARRARRPARASELARRAAAAGAASASPAMPPGANDHDAR